jgi:hypothetical protein
MLKWQSSAVSTSDRLDRAIEAGQLLAELAAEPFGAGVEVPRPAVLLELRGQLASGVGVSTDILEASGKAYLRALSNAIANDVAAEAERVLEREAKKTPTP